MPTPAFMTLQGERQGLISAGAFTEASVGNVYQLGREDQIMIQALSHGIFVPKGAGAWRMVAIRAEADFGDWPIPVRIFDQKIIELMKNPPVQASRSPRIFRLVDSVTAEPLAQQHYIATVDGQAAQRKTDGEGIAHLFAPAEVRQISMEVIGV